MLARWLATGRRVWMVDILTQAPQSFNAVMAIENLVTLGPLGPVGFRRSFVFPSGIWQGSYHPYLPTV